MSYGQVNYPQNLGTGPSVDTIAEVGCFLTAFCNLLERFGETVDPASLNNYFIAHGSYLADGPNHDNLGWSSVSAYDGNIVANQVGGPGWPPVNDAIVKFIYKSQRTGAQITHFCLVIDHTTGTILDSWDGQVKHSPYGNPAAWASYERHSAQVVAPPPPVQTETFTDEVIPGKTMQFKKNTHLWDLHQRSWPGLVNNPAGDVNSGDKFTTSRIAHHILGGSYYMPDGDNDHGYNVVDCQEYTAPRPTGPPAAPIKPSGNPDYRYTLIKDLGGFRTGTDAGNHVNQSVTVPAGEYFVYNVHPSNDTLINVTTQLGVPGSWINTSDNVPDPEPSPPTLPSVPAPVEPEPELVHSWMNDYKPFEKPVHYIAAHDLTVTDLSGKRPDIPLKRYDPGVSTVEGIVSVFGTVPKDGVDYYRLKLNSDVNSEYWYCIPKFDAVTGTANLLVMPKTPISPVSKMTVARDTIQLVKSHATLEVPRFLDDIIPKWFKNKK